MNFSTMSADELLAFIETTDDDQARSHAAWSLEDIASGDERIISHCVGWLTQRTDRPELRSAAILALGDIASGHPEAIAALRTVVGSADEPEYIRLNATTALGTIAKGDKETIHCCLYWLDITPPDSDLTSYAISVLEDIAPENDQVRYWCAAWFAQPQTGVDNRIRERIAELMLRCSAPDSRDADFARGIIASL